MDMRSFDLHHEVLLNCDKFLSTMNILIWRQIAQLIIFYFDSIRAIPLINAALKNGSTCKDGSIWDPICDFCCCSLIHCFYGWKWSISLTNSEDTWGAKKIESRCWKFHWVVLENNLYWSSGYQNGFKRNYHSRKVKQLTHKTVKSDSIISKLNAW